MRSVSVIQRNALTIIDPTVRSLIIQHILKDLKNSEVISFRQYFSILEERLGMLLVPVKKDAAGPSNSNT
jgi:hypothetical protein